MGVKEIALLALTINGTPELRSETPATVIVNLAAKGQILRKALLESLHSLVRLYQ